MADKKRLVVLDTHAILHRAYHALPELSSSRGEPTGALYGLLSILVKIIKDLKPDYIAAAFDLPGGTFRHAVYEDYKGTRAETDDALVAQIKRSRDVLTAFGVPLYDAPGYEADDVVGTIVEQTKKKKDLEIIIASGDMDTAQLVDGDRVRVFTMRKGLTDVAFYNEEAVRERYGFGPEFIPDLKGLAGDASDNIKGVPGVGEGSALKLLKVYPGLDKLYAALKKDGVEKVAKKAGVQKRFVELVATHKKEAQFSKELATIHCGAPITFSLPERGWQENVDTDQVLAMIAEFEFRSLLPRVRELLGQESSDKSSGKSNLGENGAEPELGEKSLGGGGQREHFGDKDFSKQVPAEQLGKATLAVWVLNTNITEPMLEDVLRVGKSKDFDEAFKNILAQIKEKELSFVYEQIELPLVPVLRRMEARGVLVDKECLKKLSRDYTQELEKIAARIHQAAGGEFNIASPKQLGEVLFDRLGLGHAKQKKTAGGQRSTRESELAKLKNAHPIIEDILSYRELSKLLSTYIDTIPALLDHHSRLHTTFAQTGTSTGRLGSQNPNLQNIPIKTELGRAIRNAFVASPGMQLLSFDYSQIELRIAAILSGDQGLIEIFKNGRDVHTEVASRVFHVKDNEVSYDQRRVAKVINFGILYGMGVTSLQQSLGTTRKEAQEFYNQYFEAFPRLAAYIDEVKADAARRGYTQTLFGRRRYFEGIRSAIPFVRAAAERMAVNAPIQGTATGDIPKLAMIQIDQLLEEGGRKGHLLLQVHDELLFEIEEDKVQEYAPKLQEIMESVVPDKDRRGVPITTDGKVGKDWGTMKKI